MITRNNNEAPNIVLLLLKQIDQPINHVELVESMLRADFKEKTPLNLLYWVKTLSPIYYHTILNTITVEVFRKWYKGVLSYKEEYDALSEEQQNEWELALFYFRDKFRDVFNKHSFAGILERKEKDLDILAWRLKRQPHLPLEVLAKLACLNYPKVRRHIETRIPDAEERLAFLKSAQIDEGDKLIANPWPLVAQYNRCLNMLTVKTPDQNNPLSFFSRRGIGFWGRKLHQEAKPEPAPKPDSSQNEGCSFV